MKGQHIFRKQFSFDTGAITVGLLSQDDGVCAVPHIELTLRSNIEYDQQGESSVTQQITSKTLNSLKAAVVQAKDYEYKLNSILSSIQSAS